MVENYSIEAPWSEIKFYMYMYLLIYSKINLAEITVILQTNYKAFLCKI